MSSTIFDTVSEFSGENYLDADDLLDTLEEYKSKLEEYEEDPSSMNAEELDDAKDIVKALSDIDGEISYGNRLVSEDVWEEYCQDLYNLS